MPVLNLTVPNVKAQAQAMVTVTSSTGGTTDPAPGTYAYADGTVVNFTATGIGTTNEFVQWIVVDSTNGTNFYTDNPLSLTVSGGVNYTVSADFGSAAPPIPYLIPPATTSTASTNAIVVILSATGGTTSPAAGTYSLADVSSFYITAIPDSGFTFAYWVIGGSPLTHGAYSFTDTPTNNPYNVNHGYGNTYTYQPVFLPTSSAVSMPTPTAAPAKTSTDTVIIIALAVVLVIVAILFGAFAYMKRSKK